jgi:glycosyltransferase involved in cell wall biosynthesis
VKRAIVSVTNDLVTDNRVHRTCMALKKMGFQVLFVGRQLKSSPALPVREYRMHRMKLVFTKEIWFYAEFNLRLLFFLLFRKADLLVSNDLDTIMPNYLVSKLKRIPLIYDSHELFTEVPELVNNSFARNFWLKIEKAILPHLNFTATVNDSIAVVYKERYNVEMTVVRNIPERISDSETRISREELGLPENKKILIIQGSGINMHRGSEEAVEAMQWVEDALLLIIGGGDVIPILKEKVQTLSLSEKVWFLSRQPYEKLLQYTRNADIGLSLDKDTNLNYRYSLPNKLFDYIQANIAVLVSDLPEVKKVVLEFQVGEIVNDMNPEMLAQQINKLLRNEGKLRSYKEATLRASEVLCWEKEEQSLRNLISEAIAKK